MACKAKIVPDAWVRYRRHFGSNELDDEVYEYICSIAGREIDVEFTREDIFEVGKDFWIPDDLVEGTTVPVDALEALVKKWNADAETIYATGGFYVSDLQALIDQAREET